MTNYKYSCPKCGAGSNDPQDALISIFCGNCFGKGNK